MMPHDLPPWPVVYQQMRRWPFHSTGIKFITVSKEDCRPRPYFSVAEYRRKRHAGRELGVASCLAVGNDQPDLDRRGRLSARGQAQAECALQRFGSQRAMKLSALGQAPQLPSED